MKKEIKIPAFGESVTEVEIAALLKPKGAFVQMDDELLELETDKASQVLHAPYTGHVFFIVREGQKVKVGESIGYIETKEEEQGQVSDKSSDQVAPLLSNKVDMTVVHADDLKERETRKPASLIRKMIAKHMMEAVHSMAMLTTFNEVDMTRVLEVKTSQKDEFLSTHGVRLGLIPFFVKAVVDALKVVPALNTYMDGEYIVQRNYYDMGIAVGTDHGVIVPVIKNCDELSFASIEKKLEEYAQLARLGTISADILRGGSFTITNGGVYGSLLSTPIINPPQCGILGLHKIEKRAVVVDDQIVIRPMMYVALSYDHRLVDGKEAIMFLAHIKEVLEKWK